MTNGAEKAMAQVVANGIRCSASQNIVVLSSIVMARPNCIHGLPEAASWRGEYQNSSGSMAVK